MSFFDANVLCLFLSHVNYLTRSCLTKPKPHESINAPVIEIKMNSDNEKIDFPTDTILLLKIFVLVEFRMSIQLHLTNHWSTLTVYQGEQIQQPLCA